MRFIIPESFSTMSMCAVTEARYILIMMRKQENIQTEATEDIRSRITVQRPAIIQVLSLQIQASMNIILINTADL